MTLSLSKKDVKAKVDFLSENDHQLKGTLSHLRQFLATEQPLKMMENAFYFIQKLFWFSSY